jgi:hypothetical protein
VSHARALQASSSALRSCRCELCCSSTPTSRRAATSRLYTGRASSHVPRDRMGAMGRRALHGPLCVWFVRRGTRAPVVGRGRARGWRARTGCGHQVLPRRRAICKHPHTTQYPGIATERQPARAAAVHAHPATILELQACAQRAGAKTWRQAGAFDVRAGITGARFIWALAAHLRSKPPSVAGCGAAVADRLFSLMGLSGLGMSIHARRARPRASPTHLRDACGARSAMGRRGARARGAGLPVRARAPAQSEPRRACRPCPRRRSRIPRRGDRRPRDGRRRRRDERTLPCLPRARPRSDRNALRWRGAAQERGHALAPWSCCVRGAPRARWSHRLRPLRQRRRAGATWRQWSL